MKYSDIIICCNRVATAQFLSCQQSELLQVPPCCLPASVLLRATSGAWCATRPGFGVRAIAGQVVLGLTLQKPKQFSSMRHKTATCGCDQSERRLSDKRCSWGTKLLGMPPSWSCAYPNQGSCESSSSPKLGEKTKQNKINNGIRKHLI